MFPRLLEILGGDWDWDSYTQPGDLEVSRELERQINKESNKSMNNSHRITTLLLSVFWFIWRNEKVSCHRVRASLLTISVSGWEITSILWATLRHSKTVNFICSYFCKIYSLHNRCNIFALMFVFDIVCLLFF